MSLVAMADATPGGDVTLTITDSQGTTTATGWKYQINTISSGIGISAFDQDLVWNAGLPTLTTFGSFEREFALSNLKG